MKIKKLRWVIIGLIFLATVINYIDRSALAIMWGGASDEKEVMIDLVDIIENSKVSNDSLVSFFNNKLREPSLKQDSIVSHINLITLQKPSSIKQTIESIKAGVSNEATLNLIQSFKNSKVLEKEDAVFEVLDIEKHSISRDLGLSKNDYALILNIFMVFYALGQLFSGKVFDKVGTRIGYVLSIGIWALSSFLHSTVRGLGGLLFFRSTLGISEAGNWPGGVKSNAEWFPIKERAIAQGLFNAGASIGSVIAPPLIAMLFVGYGWRVTFMVIGSFGLLWVIPWLLINKAGPKKHPWITEEEQKYILEGQSEADQNATDDTKGKSLGEILSFKESWAVVVGRFFLEPIWWLFVGWMPIYLFDVYGFNVKDVGMFLWVPYVGAAVGSIAGGFVSGKIIAKTNSIDKGRKTTILIGGVIMLLGLIATVLIGNTAEKFVVIVFFVLFGFQFAISNVQTLPSDFFSGKSVGSLAGLGGMIGVFSVIVMNFLVPIVVEKISYTPVFIAIAVFVPLGVGAIYFFARKIKSVE
ncbi:MFS transporter [Neotamlana laminarinivorans]|uniref:MFS transporter n=1 Tax=Neotamlana laminarinivorans TaxID=2883124 RepID=A0A9X1L551_9FLAO|nr:MFS transporter [Tamlana laminarinivorans]MCB4800144.1 MFS transporter [Tamlana laminarinivorans]